MLPQVVDALGADCVVTASDFPHPEGTFPHGVQALRERSDLGADAVQKILWDNYARLYNL